jgi:beta-N-acetylhexosaminidase
MIILDIEGLSLNAEDRDILLHPRVGGIIFFSRNYESPEQLAALSAEVRALRPELVQCVDQEGGRVQRFINGMTRLPPLGIVGKLVDSHAFNYEEITWFAENLALLMALEVRSLGVDLSFAPILDLDRGISQIIGDRAFHADPNWVSNLATAYMKGMSQAGMKATGKHFPGHGAVALDSHIGLPHDGRSFAQIQEDMIPFEHLIKKQIPALMTAHIVFTEVDPDPVSFSAFWLQKVLRQDLGYNGTIISDDLSMGGAHGIGSYAERAQRAYAAGCDVILVCNNRQGALEVLADDRCVGNAQSLQRCKDLLADKTVPNYKELKDYSLWQQATNVMDEYANGTSLSKN